MGRISIYDVYDAEWSIEGTIEVDLGEAGEISVDLEYHSEDVCVGLDYVDVTFEAIAEKLSEDCEIANFLSELMGLYPEEFKEACKELLDIPEKKEEEREEKETPEDYQPKLVALPKQSEDALADLLN